MGSVVDWDTILICQGNWTDTIVYCPACKPDETYKQSIEEFVIDGLGWESTLLTIGKVEGGGCSILLDMIAWENVEVYNLFFLKDL